MGISNPWFILLLIPLFFVFRRSWFKSPWAFFACLNLAFIFSVSPYHAMAWLVLGAVTYACAKFNLGIRIGWTAILVLVFVFHRLNVSEALSSLYPFGYSYVFLQHMSYLFSSEKECQTSVSAVDFFGSAHLFANIQSGPIVSPRGLLMQSPLKALLNDDLIREAFIFLFLGFFKKSIGDFFGEFSNELFREPTWRGAASLFVRYYLDFSGYSDMAVGVGLFFGVRLPLNFNLPYIAQSVADYWRRWHISLGDWFRSHVFYPLQFFLTRSEAVRGNAILLRATGPFASFVTMFLIGLWHGLTEVYFLWAIYNAVLIVISGSVAEKFKSWFGFVSVPINILITVYLVFVGQLLINAPTVLDFLMVFRRLHSLVEESTTPLADFRLVLFSVLSIVLFHILDFLIIHQKIWRLKWVFYPLLVALMYCSLVGYRPGQVFIYGSY